MTLILFDMDGVLNHYEYEWRQRELARLADLDIATFKRLWLESGWEDAAEAGSHKTARAYLDGFNAILGSSITKEEWLHIRKSAMTPNHEVLRIAKTLGENHDIAVLTNNGAMLFEHIDHLVPEVRSVFGPNVFASCQFDARKPEPEIFIKCLSKLGVSAQNAVFIDDSEVNAEGAVNAGLRAIHYASDMDLAEHPLIAPLLG